jgi:hypothetical protein
LHQALGRKEQKTADTKARIIFNSVRSTCSGHWCSAVLTDNGFVASVGVKLSNAQLGISCSEQVLFERFTVIAD